MIYDKKNRQLICFVSMILFFISLVLPAIITHRSDSSFSKLEPNYIYTGFEVLLNGSLGMFLGSYAWLANILYFPLLITFDKNFLNASRILGFLTIICLLTINIYFSHGIYPRDEGGVIKETPLYLGIGAYVWIVSLLLPAIYSFVYKKNQK